VRGLGTRKVSDFGAAIIDAVAAFCSARGLASAARPGSRPRSPQPAAAGDKPPTKGASESAAFLRQGRTLEEVASLMGRARSTVCDYLADFVQRERPASVEAWVPPETYTRVAAAMDALGPGPFRPVFERLEGAVSYDVIRVVWAHRQAHAAAAITSE
jgi:hypothetical protein